MRIYLPYCFNCRGIFAKISISSEYFNRFTGIQIFAKPAIF